MTTQARKSANTIGYSIQRAIEAGSPIAFTDTLGSALKITGYKHEFFPADWEDVGGPESGPKLVGHNDFDLWSLEVEPGTNHEIVVMDGLVVSAEFAPTFEGYYP